MKKLIEILPNIYGVKVPLESEDFEQSRSQDNYNIRLINYSVPHPVYFYQGESIEIGDFNFKILGKITKDEISFDISEVYINNLQFHKNNVEQYFRSALPKEIYFENPNPHPSDIEPTSRNHYEALKDTWQTAQQNITEKLLILQIL